MWLSHPSFEGVIHSSWPPTSLNFIETIDTLKNIIRNWNKITFGNIFYQKRLLARIKENQTNLHN